MDTNQTFTTNSNITDDWDGRYRMEVNLTANTDLDSSWTLDFNLPYTITEVYGVKLVNNGNGNYTISGENSELGLQEGESFEAVFVAEDNNEGTLTPEFLPTELDPVASALEEVIAEDTGEAVNIETSEDFEEAMVVSGLNVVYLAKGQSPTEGDDLIIADEQAQRIDGLGGDDLIIKDGINSIPNDTIIGGNGDDRISGGGGHDSLEGGLDDDVLFGDVHSNDFIEDAPVGNDSLYGGDGTDVLYGQNGTDSLRGGNGDDILYGQDGDDFLRGNGGSDNLDGGNGNDTIGGDDNNDGDVTDLLGKRDTIVGGLGDDLIDGEQGNDRLLGQEGSDTIEGGLGDDFIDGDRIGQSVDGPAADVLFGGEGNDNMIGGIGNDVLNGESGNDTLTGVGITLESSNEFGLSTIDTLEGGSNSDTFVLGQVGGIVYYDRGIPDNPGIGDYALIGDYEIGEDTLVLSGSLDEYSFGASPTEVPSGVGVFLERDTGSELIAVLQDVSIDSTEDVQTRINFV